MNSTAVETVLIVDDEEPVRKTFREWLTGANLGCRILTAADAESALRQANQELIDLAILDWNLGAGNDGLQLLEDLVLFNPEVVAILITGFAHQATPLQAMRMGVRDYLDKNQDLDRTTFLAAVRRQLERIRPAKRARRLHEGLVAFRAAVEKVLPLVQAAAVLNDPVPLPAAISVLFRFLLETTGAEDGALLVRSYDPEHDPAELWQAYDAEGRRREEALAPFARSVAGTVLSLQEPRAMTALEEAARSTALELQPFERGRKALLAAPMHVASGLQAVFELFDKQGPSGPSFTEADKRVAAAAADFGAELLRQALAERQTHSALFEAVAAALGASESMTEALQGAQPRPDEPPPADVLRHLEQGLSSGPEGLIAAGDTLRLAEAIRQLAVRHGPSSVRHCIGLVESVRALLDEAAGLPEDRGGARP
jgi:ActR/RegA family two-component response regulator